MPILRAFMPMIMAEYRIARNEFEIFSGGGDFHRLVKYHRVMYFLPSTIYANNFTHRLTLRFTAEHFSKWEVTYEAFEEDKRHLAIQPIPLMEVMEDEKLLYDVLEEIFTQVEKGRITCIEGIGEEKQQTVFDYDRKIQN